MATKAVAMPAAVWKKRRRGRPFFLPYSSPSAFIRASTLFWRSVCGMGRNSSLETTCVGTGVGLAASSAGTSLALSSSLNMPMIVLQALAETRHHLGPELLDRLHQNRVWNQAVVSVAEHPIDRLSILLGFHGPQYRVDRADIGIAVGDHLLGARESAGLGVLHTPPEAERLEPGAAGELPGIAPQRHCLLVGVGDDDVAQHAHALALGLAGDLGIDVVELVLVERMHRRQDRRDALLGAEAHRVLRAGEGLEQWRVRLLQWLGHHADRRQDAVLYALAPLRRRIEIPRRRTGRHLPELAVMGQHLLGPAFLDDAEILLEGQTIGVVDLVMLVGQRAVDAVRLLRHDVDPAPLVAARETGI